MDETPSAAPVMAGSASENPRPLCRVPDACKAKGVGTHCRSCVCLAKNADPAHRARTSEGMKRFYRTNPEKAAWHTEQLQAGRARALQDPEHRARLSENGRRFGAQNIEKTRSPEVRAKAGRAISATKLAHIPPSVRGEYIRLKDQKGLPAAERERMVLELHQAQQERGRAEVARRAAEMDAKHQRDLASRY